MQAGQQHADSVKQARERHLDSLKAAQQRQLDSIRTARQHQLDSIRAVQKARTDSLKALRAYRNSAHYKDSVAAVRQHRKDSILAVRKHVSDSIKAARQHYTDSVTAVREHVRDSIKIARQHYIDSVHAYYDSMKVVRAAKLAALKKERQRRSDSLAAIRAYRHSQRYKDSLAAIRQQRKDSIVAVRKHRQDSLSAVQKAYKDSLVVARKAYTDSVRAALDSMKLARQHMLDSLKIVRQHRSDSIAAIVAQRKKAHEKVQKEKEKKHALAFELKIKEKHQKYSNTQMLKKKWSLPRRIMQNTFTRYNYYYNAKLKMAEAKNNMLLAKNDNYDSLLSLFPYNPNVDSAKLASDMDTIISKASVGIQIHDPRSKWQDDLYLLVGQAYYYKADYKNAAAAFRQIISIDEKRRKEKEKKKHKKGKKDSEIQSFSAVRKRGIAGLVQHMPAKNKAVLWLARTLVQKDKEGQGQTLLDLLRNDAAFPENMRGRLALEQAFIYLNDGNFKNAIPALTVVATDKNIEKWQRQRAGFLAAQLFEKAKKPDSANQYYKKILALHPSLKMDFYARKNIAFNKLEANEKGENSIAILQNMAKEGKYKTFYDQIYYGIGLAALQANQPITAMKNFKKSIGFGKNNSRQMGLTYTQMGDLDYNNHRYIPAKKFYDSAAILLGKFQNMPEFQRASLRGNALAQITGPALLVVRTDSLLHLASLSEKAQKNIIKKYIRALRKAKRDSIFRAQNGEKTDNGGNLFNAPSKSSWYFANPTLVTNGAMAFKQKWGDRKLADNWNLSNNNNYNTASTDENNESNDAYINLGIPSEEALYAAIPHSSKEIKDAKDKLEQALFRLGKGYYSYLEDFQNANNTFDTLDSRFPDNPNQAEETYLRYLMAMRAGDHSKSAQYKQSLNMQFHDSKWAKMLRKANQKDTGVGATTGSIGVLNHYSADEYYNITYNLLMNQQYDSVLARCQTFSSQYPATGNYADKFELLKAVALVGTNKHQNAERLLETFIKSNKKSKLLYWAKSVLDYIHQKYHDGPENGTTNKKGLSTQQPTEKFTYNPATPYYVIIVAPADMRIFALKSGMRDFNLMRSASQNISISMTTLNPENNMIICRTFKNQAQAEAYLKDIQNNRKLFRQYTQHKYHLLLISEHNYQIMTAQRSITKYMQFYAQHFH